MGVEQKGGQPGPIERFISWRPFRPHYEKFETKAAALNDEELLNKRSKYDHLVRNTIIITGLSSTVFVGGLSALGPYLPTEALLFCPGPSALVICMLGPTRGIVRKEEREILDEEIARRGLQDLSSSPQTE